ncbi:MAG: hypothetical protein RL425_316 [Pseudomonadota bacterium]
MKFAQILMKSPLLMMFSLAACATTADREAGDPLGSYNRGMWKFNETVDKIAVKPVTQVYRAVTPRPARQGLSRIFDNLEEPFSAANALLQGKPKRAGRSLARFVINTTLGVGGIADQATRFGIHAAPEDFGQTMAVWGMRPGPYLVLPLLGPSDFRDGIGTGIGFFTNPWRVGLRETGASQGVRYGVAAVEVIDIRNRLIENGADSALASSADSYALARSAFQQFRQVQVENRDEGDDNAGQKGGSDLDRALDAAVIDAGDTGVTNSATVPPAAPAVAPELVPPATDLGAENMAPDQKNAPIHPADAGAPAPVVLP